MRISAHIFYRLAISLFLFSVLAFGWGWKREEMLQGIDNLALPQRAKIAMIVALVLLPLFAAMRSLNPLVDVIGEWWESRKGGGR